MVEKTVCIVGSGGAGLSAAWTLSKSGMDITLVEASDTLGGHALTRDFELSDGERISVDLGFMVFNELNYPNMVRMFGQLGVLSRPTSMSFGVSLQGGKFEWSSAGITSMFADPKNILRPSFWKMLWEIRKFNKLGTSMVHRWMRDPERMGNSSSTDSDIDDSAFVDGNSNSKSSNVSHSPNDHAASDASTVKEWLALHKFSETFAQGYLIPMASCVWSASGRDIELFPIRTLLQFLHNHKLLQTSGQPVWQTVVGGSRSYVTKIQQALIDVGARILFNTKVGRVERSTPGGPAQVNVPGNANVNVPGNANVSVPGNANVSVPGNANVNVPGNANVSVDVSVSVTPDAQGQTRVYAKTGECLGSFDYVVMATHADDTVKMMSDLSTEEKKILGCFAYQAAEIYTHTDASLMPLRKAAWSCWNFMSNDSVSERAGNQDPVFVSYSLNKLQGLESSTQVFESLNPLVPPAPEKVLDHRVLSHPLFTVETEMAQKLLPTIQGNGGVYYAGAWCTYGFHEDAVHSGLAAGLSVVVAAGKGHVLPFELVEHTLVRQSRGEGAAEIENVNANAGERLASKSEFAQEGAGECISKPSVYERLVGKWFASTLLSRFERMIKVGKLAVVVQGKNHVFGSVSKQSGVKVDRKVDIEATLVIHDLVAFCGRVMSTGDIGFGEGFMARDWSSPDLVALLSLLLLNRDEEGTHKIEDAVSTWAGRGMEMVRHWTNRNRLSQTRKNISKHYDLGNEFYKTFLDPTMSYSCAMYGGAATDGDVVKDDLCNSATLLNEAQKRKMAHLGQKLKLDASCRVVEIGFGWGSMAIHLAQTYGCSVYGISLSTEQLDYALEAVSKAGVGHLVTLELVDYRALDPKYVGYFDRVISVEMIEAVGDKYMKEFFTCCQKYLKPEGFMVMQGILMPDDRFEAYRKSTDWIQKHIFKGGFLPSLGYIVECAMPFTVHHIESIGYDYALTLEQWRRAFVANLPRVRELGFDDVFIRKWIYYLSSCEALFRMGSCLTYQLVLGNPSS